jgi:hypothetical protein
MKGRGSGSWASERGKIATDGRTVNGPPTNNDRRVTKKKQKANSMFYASGLQPGVCVPPEVLEDILRRTQKHLTSIMTKHRNRFDFEPALFLTLTKISPRIEVLTCQKQAQSSP